MTPIITRRLAHWTIAAVLITGTVGALIWWLSRPDVVQGSIGAVANAIFSAWLIHHHIQGAPVTPTPRIGEPMNLQALLAQLIGRGLSTIPNQSAQTQADAQAVSLALSTFVVDLAKDEALAEIHNLAANQNVQALIAKIPALANLLKTA